MAGAAWAWPVAITAADDEQPRFNLAAPVPQGAAELTQTFRPRHAGLSVIELLAVVYRSDAEPAEPQELTLELRDAAEQVVAAHTFRAVAHNAPLALTFAPQPYSAGQTYTLALRGPAGSAATAWAYGLDGYAGGELRLAGVLQPGDLRFTTRYTYLWPSLVRDAVLAVGQLLPKAGLLWLVLFAPGLLLLGTWPAGAARWGLALALSLAVSGLLWLWIGVVGLRWSPLGLGLVYGALGLALGAHWLRAFRRQPPHLIPHWPSAHTLTLIGLLALGLLVRLLAARDVLLPQWVDGSHHYAIARVLAEAGYVPPGYAPLWPIARLSYHFGFHALAVTLSWLTGQPLAATFVWLGQVLQGLVPLAAYAAVAGLTGRARAGWLAAAFLALISYFPGYYLTWGRYTQLTGTLLLLPGLAWAARVAARPPAEGPAPRGIAEALRLGLLAAGLFVTHYAVFVLWVVFVAVVSVVQPPHGLARRLARMALAAAVGALAAAPWLLRLGAAIARAPLNLAAPAGYNAFPLEYFNSSLERGWLALAALVAAWGLLRRDLTIWRMALWGAATVALVNIGQGNWLVTNNTLAITLFVPGATILGWGGDRWLFQAQRWLSAPRPASATAGPSQPRSPRLQSLAGHWRPVAGALMVAALAGALGYGGAQGMATQVNIVNPDTVLVTRADHEALAWVAAHVPPSAVFAVNSWEWLNGTWAGSDAGAWLWPLLSLRTTMPPTDYIYAGPAWETPVNDFNRRLRAVTDAEAPATLALLRAAGVTHVFIGARGGGLTPEMFVNQPHYRLLYSNGAAWVFAFTAAQSRAPG
jgi:hypothetical protein